MKKTEPEPGQFGPVYDVNSQTLGRFRQAAKDGLSSLERAQVVAYARAVEDAVLGAQRSSLRREKSPPASMSASGTFHNRGQDIHAAIRAKQRAALAAAPSRERRARTPHEWETMYLQAMAEKPKPRPAPPSFGICGYTVLTS